jgi:regulatory protein
MKSECKYSLLEAKVKLEALCAYQERCSFELEKKMQLWGLDPENQRILLADLITNNFLNEERFAEAFVSGRINIKKWGRIKIKMELKRKFISDYSINKAIASIDGDAYWNNLKHLTIQKSRLLKQEKDAFKKKVKLFRFLNSKGYEQDLIHEVYQELINEL